MRSLQLTKWLAVGAIALLFGQRRARRSVTKLVADLSTASGEASPQLDAPALDRLPPAVGRYLQRVLPQDRLNLRGVTLKQRGMLRTTGSSDRWMPFSATHVANAVEPGFVWDAQVKVMPFFHLSVLDKLTHGTGAGRVALMSLFKVGGESGTPEMNSGALHRYLAEAVWYPAALLPSDRLTWSPIDPYTALATLREGATEVSLEFRFSDTDEVESVFAEGRWGLFDGKFERRPWEGHFSKYERVDGVLIPMRGEVGWYHEARLDLVWKGEISAAKLMLS